jgi:hypothetical protein
VVEAIASVALPLSAAAAWTTCHRPQRHWVSSSAAALAAALFAFLVAGVSPGAALASAGWSIQSTPNPFVGGGVASVACASTTSCAGVGSYTNSSNRQEMLAEQWNGTGWAIPATANPSGVVDSSLTGVSCVSGNACTAVGNGLSSSDTDVTMAGVWNGTAWAFQTVPSPAYSSLTGVSCTAQSDCTAVGSSDISSTSSQTLALVWNGSNWTEQSTPNPAGATISALSNVSCTAGGACAAVGYYVNSSGADATLAERWTASTGWTIDLPPNPGGAPSVLTGVSCTSGNACTAVGHSVDGSGVQQTLAEHWDGTSWTITLNSSGATNRSLSGLSCTADNACIAVGQASGATLAEQWNPGTSSWTTLNTSVPTTSALSGVSCTADNACTAVGQANGGTLAEQWNGTTWTIQTTPNPAGTGILSSVSCATGTACSAVGYSNPENSLAEQWDGTNWTIYASLNTQNTALHPVLSGVSCTAANACIAVGAVNHIYCPTYCNRGFKIVTGTAAMQWNGTNWSRMSTPNPSQGTPSSLSSVSCPAANDCVAVGSSGGGSLVEAWNGTGWTLQTPAAIGALSSVSCPTSKFCITVGGSQAEQWNGATWTSQTTATPTGGVLAGVSCTSATACIAVGSSGGKTLAEAWNGEIWSVQTTPNPAGATSSTLSAVSCPPAANACTAVGNYVNPSGAHLTLAEQWNGTWGIQTTPNPSATYSVLSGVSCITATACTAVGDSINASGTDVTLAETYF